MPENEVLKLSSVVNLINALKATSAQALLATGITEWSFEVDVKPVITGVDDTRGAYFTAEGLLQQIIEDSGVWLDAGDPIITERYFETSAIFNGILGIATKALLDADTSQDDGTLRRVTNDSTASNNGVYRWDDSGSEWVKEIGLGVSVLDPDDETDLLYGKAVSDHITTKVIGSEPVSTPEDGFKFFSKLHRKFLTWSGADWRDEQGAKVHLPFIYRNGVNGITKTVDDIVTDWADVYDINTTTVDDADGQTSGINGALPEWQDAVVNSLPAIYFDGSDRFLSVSRKGLTECTVYAVVKMQTESEEMRLLDFWDDGSAEGGAHAIQLQVDRDLESLYGFARDTGGNFSYTKGKFDDWCVIGLRAKSGEYIQSFLNSAFGDRIVIEDFDGVASNNSWIIGANRDHDENFFKGWLAEFVMFDKLMGNDEHNLIINSLLDKYGLTPTKEGYAPAGQSQIMGRGESASSPAVVSGTGYEYEGDVTTGYSASELNDPVTGIFENSDTGSFMPAFVNALYAKIKKPVYMIPAGKGGTALTIAADSGNGNWNKTDDTLFEQTCQAINSFIHDGGILRAIHWIQGERDAQYLDTLSGAALITAQQNYRLALPELINNFREYYPGVPFIITQTGRLTSGDTTGFQFVRQVQKDVAQQLPNVYLDYENAVNFEDLSWMDVDGIHWDQDGLNDIGEKKGIFTFNAVYN
ncbi:MAG: sialate O-acetylesterase [Balneola sp.]